MSYPKTLAAGALALAFSTLSVAQPAATNTPPKPTGSDEEAVVLNAFEVRADNDNSYGALESNSITRFRTDLDTLPVDASVFTKTFMDDIAATNVEDMLVSYAGAYAGSADPSSNAIAGEQGDRQGSGEFSIGGLKLSVRRDGFVAMSANTRGPVGATDSFSVERAELIHGPQSLLYGGAGAGGIANIVSKQAHFNQRKGQARVSFDQYGSKRTELDYNYGAKNVAARVSLLRLDKASYRYLIDSHADGAYAQLAFKLPFHTLLRIWGQSVDARSINSFRLSNVDPFLPTGDPRRGKNARFLIASGQADDIRIGNNPLTFGNVDSFTSQWTADNVEDKFVGASLETIVNSWLSTQLAVVYEDTDALQIAPTKALLNGTNAANPFPGEAAVSVAFNSGTNIQPSRKKAIRYSMLFEKGFFDSRWNTQTILGVESVSQRSGNINSAYYLADSNWVVDHSNTATATSAYGRTVAPTMYFSIQNGIPKYPLFTPGVNRITLNGKNYVVESMRLPNTTTPTQLNPLGITGGSGTYSISRINTRAFYAAHVSSFFQNRLKFLGGARFDDQSGAQQGITSTGLKNALYGKNKLSYNLGLNYTVLPRVNVFVSRSTAFDPDTSTSDPYGYPLLSSVSHGIQAGIRYSTPNRAMNASLTYQSAVGTNQTQLIDQSWLDAINPNGINGRYAAYAGSDRWVNVDRKSDSLRLQVDLHPVRNWRATLNGTFADARVESDGTFAQLYNDEFYLKNGGITYADGTPVMVDPTGGKNPNTPLTLDMINTASNRYWANPDPDSGRITNSNLINVLTTDTGHGVAATGRNGLPISAIQYNWTDPYGHAGVLAPVAGNQYTAGPRYTFSFLNHYEFTQSWLKGFSVGAGVTASYKNYAYYYTVGGSKATAGKRVPFILPSPAIFEYSLGYNFKIAKRYTFRTQLNVKNAFNHYYYVVIPTASNGAYENARLIGSPRLFLWTNTISF